MNMRSPSRELFIQTLALLALAGAHRAVPLSVVADTSSSLQQAATAAFINSTPCRRISSSSNRHSGHHQHVQQAPTMRHHPHTAILPGGNKANTRRRYLRYRQYASAGGVAAADSSFVRVGGNNERPSAGVWSAAPNDPTFRELFSDRLPEWLLARLEELGFASPTLVQRESLEVILGEGRDGQKADAVVHAQTGSGKTLAFLLPLFASLDPSRSAVQALVVVPTRELGLQVAGVAKRLAAATVGGAAATTGDSFDSKRRIQVMSVLDGSNNRRQRAWAWADPPHVVIGNPENLTKLVTTGAIRVNAVQYVVVDEVDACLLSDTTRASLHELLARSLSPTHAEEDQAKEEEEAARLAASGIQIGGAPPVVVRKLTDRQTVFASATVPQHNHFIKQCVQKQWTLTEPVHIQVHGKEAMPPCLSHFYVVCPEDQKLPVLRALVRRELGSRSATAGQGLGSLSFSKSSSSDGLNADARALVFAHATKPLERIAGSLHAALGGERGQREEELDSGKNNWGGAAGAASSPPLAECLREELGLNKRADTMALFREGQTRLLVATDMAARGLDVPEISHVFNLDFPADGEGYVHRGGRAGRLGRSGKIVSIITPAQEFAMRRLGNGIGIDIKKISFGVKSSGSTAAGSKRGAAEVNSKSEEDGR